MGDFDCCAAKPVPDAQHDAVLAAMREAGCGRYVHLRWPDIATCLEHEKAWDEARDVCAVIDAAVAIGYSAGRRDALTEAADIASQERTTRTGAYHVGGNEALTLVAERLRALASTPTNEGAETDG